MKKAPSLQPSSDADTRKGLNAPTAHQALLQEVAELRRRNAELEALRFEHEHALRSLRHVNLQLSTVVASISDGFFALDGNLVVTFFNTAAERMLGKLRSEVLGRPLFEVFSEARGTLFETSCRRAITTQTPEIFEAYLEPWQTWFEVRAYPFEGGLSVYFRDTSEQRQAAQALEESRRHLESVFESIPLSLVLISPDFRIQAFNRLADERSQLMYGRSPRLGASVFEFRPAHEHELLRSIIERALAGENQAFEGHYALVNGETRWDLTQFVPARADDGTTEAVCFVAEDITALKRAQHARRHSDLRYQTLTDALPDAVAVFDKQGIIQFGNDALARYVGRRALTLTGQPLDQVFPQALVEQRQQVIAHVLEHKEPLAFEERWESSLGTRYFSTRFVPITEEDDVSSVLSVSRDVTDQRRVESARRRLEEQVQHAQKLESLGLLAGGIAHDFNNLLMAILGHAQVMQRRVDNDPPLQRSVKAVEHAALRASELTRQLLGFARKGKWLDTTIDMHQLIAGLLTILRRTLHKSITLATTLNATSPFVVGDPSQIEQVLMNLIINARDAIHGPGTLTISTTNVRLNVEDAHACGVGDFIEVCVRDSGVGMSEDVRARIFEPFFTTKPKGAGTGMGLAMVYGIVENHGGAIDVQSTLGKGTCVSVLLPRHHPGDQGNITG